MRALHLLCKAYCLIAAPAPTRSCNGRSIPVTAGMQCWTLVPRDSYSGHMVPCILLGCHSVLAWWVRTSAGSIPIPSTFRYRYRFNTFSRRFFVCSPQWSIPRKGVKIRERKQKSKLTKKHFSGVITLFSFSVLEAKSLPFCLCSLT